MKCAQAALILVIASAVDAFVQPGASFTSKVPVASSTISKPTPFVVRKSILLSKPDETGDDEEEPSNPYADPNYPEVSYGDFS